jgi:tetratricopeptide (TPR) repeat protein
MTTAMLEEKLAANPKSPLFARLASHYLAEGNVERAIDLLESGLREYPDYATAHLILGRSFESFGRTVEALVEYRRVLKAVPDNPTVRHLVERVERKEQEAFEAFAEQRVRELRGLRGTLSFEGFVADAEPPEPESQAEGEPTGPWKTFVTPTLADIYAQQGQYGEAIAAYRRLIRERPGEAELYAQRIIELEETARSQRAGTGTLDHS